MADSAALDLVLTSPSALECASAALSAFALAALVPSSARLYASSAAIIVLGLPDLRASASARSARSRFSAEAASLFLAAVRAPPVLAAASCACLSAWAAWAASALRRGMDLVSGAVRASATWDPFVLAASEKDFVKAPAASLPARPRSLVACEETFL